MTGYTGLRAWNLCLVSSHSSNKLEMPTIRQFQVVGRKAPTDTDPNPPCFRMKLFAPNEVLAKSRFWYFLHQMKKMKKTTGEILDVNEVLYLLYSLY